MDEQKPVLLAPGRPRKSRAEIMASPNAAKKEYYEQVAKEIARRGVELHIPREDNIAILRMVLQLAEVERASGVPENDVFGFARWLVGCPSPKMRIQIINKSKKYWPFDSMIPEVEKILFPAASPEPAQKVPKPVMVDPLCVVYQVHTEQPYEAAGLRSILQQYLSARVQHGRVQIENVAVRGATFDLDVTQTAFVSEVVELLTAVTWIQQVLTKPYVRAGVFFPVPRRKYGFVV